MTSTTRSDRFHLHLLTAILCSFLLTILTPALNASASATGPLSSSVTAPTAIAPSLTTPATGMAIQFYAPDGTTFAFAGAIEVNEDGGWDLFVGADSNWPKTYRYWIETDAGSQSAKAESDETMDVGWWGSCDKISVGCGQALFYDGDGVRLGQAAVTETVAAQLGSMLVTRTIELGTFVSCG